MSNSVQGVVLGYVLILAGLAIHEVGHVVVLFLFGNGGTLAIDSWRLGIAEYYIYGIHVEPIVPLDFFNRALSDFLAPAMAIIPFALLLRYVKEQIPRVAIIANIFALAFFAILEPSYVIMENTLHREVGILGSPEFNIGVPILILLGLVYWKIWKAA
jgi:hypothetical protein